MNLDLDSNNIDEIRIILGHVTPDDAVDQEHLDQACEYAMTFWPEISAEAGTIRFVHATQSTIASEVTRFILKQLLNKRTTWLRENGGYRRMTAMG